MSDDDHKWDENPSPNGTYASFKDDGAATPAEKPVVPATGDELAMQEGAATDVPADDGVIGTASLIDSYTAGGILKAARESQELSIEAVSRSLMLNQRAIEALERTMQPPGFDMRRTRIAAKSYAKYLGINADSVLADFPSDEQPKLATAVPRSSVTQSARSRARFAIPAAIMGATVVAIGVAAVILTPGQGAEGRAVPSVAERVVAVNTAQESLFAREPLRSAASETMELSIAALEPAWIEVRGPDGTIFRSRTMARGEIYYPRVGAGWTVTVQNGSAFEWRIDDRGVARLADEALPIYSASIDEAAALAANEAEPVMAATSNSRPSR